MGKVGNDNNAIDHQRRVAPPSLQSVPGAHRFGGVDGHPSPSSAQGDKSGKTDNTGSPRSVFQKGGVDPALNKSTTSMGKSSTTSRTEDSVDASQAPPTIPLESDYFDRTLPEPKPQWVIPVVFMALTAILAIVIPVAVILGGRGQETPPQVRHTPAPIAKPNMTLEELHQLVPGLPQETLDRINADPVSPQASALDWIKADYYNDWDAYEDYRKVQRYALAVFFFAMGGTGWKNSWNRADWLQYHQHECDWTRNSRPFAMDLCNDEGFAAHITFTKLGYLKGMIPPEIALLSHVRIMDFSECPVGDDIDTLLSKLTEVDQDLSRFFPSLEVLALPDAGLVGVIPTSLSTITTLQQLDLSMNDNIVGTIPSELGLLEDLKYLDLSQNKLNGTIPFQLGELPMLNEVVVVDNRLEGPVPESFCYGGNMTDGLSFLGNLTVLITDWCAGEACCLSAP